MSDATTLSTVVTGLVSALSAYMTYKVGLEQARKAGEKPPERTEEVKTGEIVGQELAHNLQQHGGNSESGAFDAYFTQFAASPEQAATMLTQALVDAIAQNPLLRTQLQHLAEQQGIGNTVPHRTHTRENTWKVSHLNVDTNIGGVGSRFEGSVTFNVGTSSAPTFEDLFKQGIAALRVGNYSLAKAKMSRATQEDPNNADTYYYLALASLQGKRPKLLNINDIENIVRYLETACRVSSPKAQYLYLWALVRSDFYGTKGFAASLSNIDKILDLANKTPVSSEELSELLRHCYVSQNRVTLAIEARL